ELLPLLPLLHVFGEPRLLVPLRHRVIEILRRLVIPRQLPQFLFSQRCGLHSSLVEGNGLPQILLFLPEGLQVPHSPSGARLPRGGRPTGSPRLVSLRGGQPPFQG